MIAGINYNYAKQNIKLGLFRLSPPPTDPKEMKPCDETLESGEPENTEMPLK